MQTTQPQRHPDAEYLSLHLFEGDESELTCHSIRMRTARKHHKCFGLEGQADHSIEPGQRYREERARVDGSFWGRYCMCIPCLDQTIATLNGEDSEEDD